MDRSCWMQVDLDAVSANTRAVQEWVGPQTRLMAVVKAEGYGHGASAIAHAALAGGAHQIGVAVIEEALALRGEGIGAPICVLSPPLPGQLPAVVEADLAVGICDLQSAERLSDLAQGRRTSVQVHIKVDTGLGRFGLQPSDVLPFTRRIASLPAVRVAGIYTHLATAETPGDAYAREQLSRFRDVLTDLAGASIPIGGAHAAGSAAILTLPESHLDLVRPGLLLVGLDPTTGRRGGLPLRPAMSVYTRVAFLKEVEAGASIGYGRAYIASRRMRIATLPAGFATGYPRSLGGKEEVLIRGRRAPILGRIGLNSMMVDVSHIPGVAVGDLVTLVGRDGQEEVTVYELAERAGTIIDEICLIGSRVPRVYRQAGMAAPQSLPTTKPPKLSPR